MTTLSFTSEREFQQAIIGVAKLGGWMYMHITDSRKSAAVGFPDLVLCHPRTGRLRFFELKMPKGKVSTEQARWLAALQHGGHEATILRPDDWESGAIQSTLLAERMAA